jgi:hypothetical protein
MDVDLDLPIDDKNSSNEKEGEVVDEGENAD